MTTRWMHPPEIERQRQRHRFDPVAAGDRYGLSRDLSLAIWKHVCADVADGNGRPTEQAERRFHQMAARIAARGGRARPDVGRLTRAGIELGGTSPDAGVFDELAPRVPGRQTLVAVDARRWDVQDQAAAPASLELPETPGVEAMVSAHVRRTFGPAAGDVPIAVNSTRPLAAGAEGVAVGEQVYIAPGYYDLTTTEGRQRLGHEVAHVLQQRRGRGLPGRLDGSERAGLEAEADRAGHAFARGMPFAVQGRAPTQVALFKGAKPPAAGSTTTTIDLKSGGRIERKPPAPEPTGAAAPAAGAKGKASAKEQLIVTYGAVQASNPFTIERDESGKAVKLTGSGKLSLPASKYIKPIELDISLSPDGTIVAKKKANSTQTLKIGGLTVRGGFLSAAVESGQLTYALDGVTISLPKNIGEGALTIQGSGDQEPSFDASLAINVPKLHPATMSFHADATGYRAEGSTGVDIKNVSGSVTFGIEKVGEDRALWSAAGSVGYSSERMSGQVSVQYNADGELSGEGTLDFKIANFLTGSANVAVDKKGNVAVHGEIRPPNETQLFPEKKIEQTFFKHSVEFPIWGISIPMVGSVGIIAFIEGSLGYRVGVGAGVMRNIVLSGDYSTDPSVEPTFQITGEIFIPAFAELLISVGGGVKLSAFIAEVGGGVKVDGRAGFYGGLSVKPTLAYEGGKYRLMGQAILGGDVGLSAQVDAFVRLHVGKWMFSWEKEWNWKLAEWNKWLGLNLGMEADLDYTLGEPLSPDIFKLKKPDSIDVQDIAKSAMPQGGMPAQGPKGAQNQKNEFKQKGGGGAAAPSSKAAQPAIAGTPAGAAGHKNQDPKGKNVKPSKPPKSGPTKPAKGKGPNQTGPNPKNKSKPSEQKLDGTPIVERFSMNGEPHQLIVQLGPSGHVDMASKRERLSVKVGGAVGKLIAKQASPQQIADLKEIGATAKRGDKMVAKAKLTDKPGTSQVAQQIAAYGNKWQVKDLHEVAIKAPASLAVPRPVHLEKLSEALNKALGTAQSGQVIFNKPGDPKQITRELLEKHKDARFDFPSARLTLPAPQAGPLAAATSAAQLGQLLAQQTGVSKVSLKKTEQKGELKLELTGAIGAASASLGTAVVEAVPKSLAVARPLHLEKPSEALSKALRTATSGQAILQKPGDPKQITRQILQKHADAKFDFATAKLTLPTPQAAALQSAQTVDQLGQLLAQQTGVSKITLKKIEQKDELKFELVGAIGDMTVPLGTVTAGPVDLKGACEAVGGVAKVKYSDVMAERQPGAVAVRPAFITGATERLKPDPKKPLEAMRNEVSGSGDKYILKGDLIPVEEIIGQQGISRVLDLPSVFNYYLDGSYKSRLKLTSPDDFIKACAEGKFNPKTDLNDGAEIRGKVAESWWFAKARAGGVTLGQIKKDLTVMDTTYDKGMLRLNISAAELAAANIALHKPTAFDGMMQGWGDDPMWKAAPGGSAWGLTRDGMQEGVIKASRLGVFKDRKLILPEPMPKVDEIEVPKVLVENRKIELTQVSDAIEAEAKKTASGTVLYESGASDPKAVTKALLADHPEAKLDPATGVLTLPAVKGDGAATSLRALAAQVAQSTGVSKITFVITDKGWRLDGSINPTVDGLVWHTATGAGLDPLIKSLQSEIGKQQPNRDLLIAICRERAAKFDAKVEFEYFAREDVTLVGFTELTPAPGKSPGTFTVEILPGSPAAGTKNADCPSCKAATGVSKPHNVIPASMWKGIISDTLKKSPYNVTSSDAYYESIIAVGAATGGPAVTQDKQCPVCEGIQDARGAGGPYSLVQRMNAPTTMPNKQDYVGNQFKDTNPDQALELTKLKIEQVIDRIRRLLGLADTGAGGARPSTSEIYRNVVTPGRTDDLLRDMHDEALKRATATVAPGDYPP